MTERRFELFRKHVIKDNGENTYPIIFDAGIACVILNEQDQKIKELKEEIKQLKFDCAMYKSANYLINEIGINKAREVFFQTEKIMIQKQNIKAVEVLEKVRKFYNTNSDSDWIIDLCELNEFVDNQIKRTWRRRE